jgi:transcriptional regulator with XRE-family HTH domain
MYALMDTTNDRFVWAEWLKAERTRQELSQSDLARKADVNRQIINDYEKFKRPKPETEILAKISAALGYPADYLPRMAGKLPPEPEADDILNQIAHLYHTLKDPANKQRGLEFFQFLKTQDEKGDYDVSKSPQPKPR